MRSINVIQLVLLEKNRLKCSKVPKLRADFTFRPSTPKIVMVVIQLDLVLHHWSFYQFC